MTADNKIPEKDKALMVDALKSAETVVKRAQIIPDPLKESNYRLIVTDIAIALFEKSKQQ